MLFPTNRFKFKRKKDLSRTSSVPAEVRVYRFEEDGRIMKTDTIPEDSERPLYVQVIGMSDQERIKAICDSCGIDPMTTEDILHIPQRNKIERADQGLFVCLHVFHDTDQHTREDYFSMFVTPGMVISFHEEEPMFLQDVTMRMRDFLNHSSGRGHALFYVLMDTITDVHIKAQDLSDEAMAEMETGLFDETGETTCESSLYALRKRVLTLKNNVAPIARQLEAWSDDGHIPVFSAEIQLYLRDLLDHLQRLEQRTLEAGELLRNMIDVHDARQANRMNKIMTMLTLFSAIFIPLSFLTGFFGMNFVHFGVLSYEHAVGLLIGVCVSIAIGMVAFFRWKRWL